MTFCLEVLLGYVADHCFEVSCGRDAGLGRSQVAAQEVELVGDRPLAPFAHVDVEVRARVLAHLDAALGPPGGGTRRGGRGDGVPVGDLRPGSGSEARPSA